MTTDPSLPVAHNPPADPTKSSTLSVASNRPFPAKANQLPLSHEPTSKTTDLKSPASRMQLDSEAPQPTGIGSEQGFEANFDLTQDPTNQMSITAVGNEENVVANHPSDRQPMTGINCLRDPPPSDTKPKASLTTEQEEAGGRDKEESEDDGDDHDDVKLTTN
ncbi:hypothetical protein PCASD_20683 [Puccinia coronata f. sp. avenae]|uniref:Uncharacterized protein n=1 Tax=Puccinia coronata f. sp. avenae TaxID=200324 RepID=A0A2N5TPC2_9BASI|nr:hypothetical protein PCASD_20683 [Puccinia coronata f. sp. avenae]